MILELQDRRIIAAIQCVDAVIGEPIRDGLIINGDGVNTIRNRRGLYVLASANGFESYTRQFELNGLETPTSEIILHIEDPRNRYLPRQYQLSAPRSVLSEAEDSVFEPITLSLFPAPTFARIQPGWAIIRASLTENITGRLLSWALVEITRESEPTIQSFSQADDRGEILITIPEIPITLWSSDPPPSENEEETPPPILQSEVEVSATVFVPLDSTPIPPNPDVLLAEREQLPSGTLSISVAPGRTQLMTLNFTLSAPA